VAESAGKSAEEQLAEARESADKYSHEASSLRAKFKSLEQDMNIVSKANDEEIKKLKSEIEKLTAQIAITEDNCRTEYIAVLNSSGLEFTHVFSVSQLN
jgi:hypothetical protein